MTLPLLLWKSAPTFREVLQVSLTKISLEATFPEIDMSLGDHPASRTAARDFTKIPSVMSLAYQDAQVGGTDYKYDASHVWASFAKLSTKVGILYHESTSYSGIIPEGALEISARQANYAAEIVSRTIIDSGKSLQDLPDDQKINFFIHFVKNFDPTWILKGIPEAMYKTLLADMLGSHIKSLDIKASHSEMGCHWSLKILNATDITLPEDYCKKSIEEKFQSLINGSPEFNTWSTYITVAAGNFVPKLEADILISYLLMIPTRYTQDVVGKLVALNPLAAATVYGLMIAYSAYGYQDEIGEMYNEHLGPYVQHITQVITDNFNTTKEYHNFENPICPIEEDMSSIHHSDL